MAQTRSTAFEKVTRNMVENLTCDFKEFKMDIKKEFDELRATNTQLYNHLSSRLPGWATAIISLGGAILTGLIVYLVTN